MTKHTSFPQTSTSESEPLINQVLRFFEEVLQPLPTSSATPRSRGCPATIFIPQLLLACLLHTMRQTFSPAAIKRTLLLEPLGSFAPLASITRQAVRQRLLAIGLAPFTTLLQQVQEALTRRGSRSNALPLASFASMVVAVDESELAAVAQLCDDVALVPNQKEGLLVGKLCAVFDLRRQQWVHVQFLSDPFGSGTLNALLLLEALPVGSLILADLGYFGFLWFQYLSEQGHFWLSRLKSTTSYRIEHILYQRGDTLDALIWLGTYRSNQYPYLVRLVQYRQGTTLYRYITNVLDPSLLPLSEVPVLYGRRWDIEMAFKVLKRTLGVHLWWACERVLVLQQLLLALSVSQVIHFLQGEIAAEAGVHPLEVSLDILMKVLPHACWSGSKGVAAALADHGRQLGLIRPSRYLQFDLPVVLAQDIVPLPPETPRSRPAKHTVRKRPRHPRRTDPFDFRFFPLLLI